MLAMTCILELSSQKSHAADREEGHRVGDTSPERQSEVLIWTRTGTELTVPHLWPQPLNHSVCQFFEVLPGNPQMCIPQDKFPCATWSPFCPGEFLKG